MSQVPGIFRTVRTFRMLKGSCTASSASSAPFTSLGTKKNTSAENTKNSAPLTHRRLRHAAPSASGSREPSPSTAAPRKPTPTKPMTVPNMPRTNSEVENMRPCSAALPILRVSFR